MGLARGHGSYCMSRLRIAGLPRLVLSAEENASKDPKKLNFFFGGHFLVKCFPALNLFQSVYMSYFPSFLPFSLCLHLFEGHSGVNESIVPEGGRLALQRGLSVAVELWDSVPSGV